MKVILIERIKKKVWVHYLHHKVLEYMKVYGKMINHMDQVLCIIKMDLKHLKENLKMVKKMVKELNLIEMEKSYVKLCLKMVLKMDNVLNIMVKKVY